MKKILLISLGVILVGIGIVGIILPGLPTTIFLIAAAACFAKSSPKLYAWLTQHRWFGPIITNWNKNKSIPKRAKIIALIMMLVACIYSMLILESLYLKLTILAIMIFPAFYVSRLPNSEDFEE